MLPSDVLNSLSNKVLFDFGLQVEESRFEVKESYCVLPNALVLSYALAVLVAGKAKRILLAGFDGYGADDPRRKEVDHIFELFMSNFEHCPLLSVTPTRYQIPVASVYGLIS